MPTETKATLTCPECGFAESMDMPVDYCLFFHDCSICKTVLRPKQGDDCVFCSYADHDCPPKQLEGPSPR